jgi:hypothetical protein
MLKRVVALLLLPTVLLAQCACAVRCHGCRHVADHDRSPHLHLVGWPFMESTQARGHLHRGHHRCCHHHGSKKVSDGNNRCPLVQHEDDSADHQGGIIHLPTSLTNAWLTGRTPSSSDDVGNTLPLPLSDNLLTRVLPLVCTHTPPLILATPDTPASLRVLPLLI